MTHRFVDRASDRIVETAIRIATWNVWWRFGARWRDRQPLIAEALRASGADVVGLQEVWGGEGADQASELARSLGFHATYAAASFIDGIGFGNAVISRWPIVDGGALLLPSMPSADGGRDCKVTRARIAGPRGALDVYSTHLSWRPEEGWKRQEQAEALLGFVASSAAGEVPPVVCGDFNAVPSSDEIRLLTGERAAATRGLVLRDAWTAAGRTGAGFTWSNANPQAARALQPDRRLDYVFVGLPRDDGVGHVTGCERFGTEPVDGLWPSDHAAVLATLRY